MSGSPVGVEARLLGKRYQLPIIVVKPSFSRQQGACTGTVKAFYELSADSVDSANMQRQREEALNASNA